MPGHRRRDNRKARDLSSILHTEPVPIPRSALADRYVAEGPTLVEQRVASGRRSECASLMPSSNAIHHRRRSKRCKASSYRNALASPVASRIAAEFLVVGPLNLHDASGVTPLSSSAPVYPPLSRRPPTTHSLSTRPSRTNPFESTDRTMSRVWRRSRRSYP